MKLTASIAASVVALATAASAQSQYIADKLASLKAATSEVERVKVLQDEDFVFNFLDLAEGETTGSGGHTVAASSTNFPAIIGNGMAMTVGFLGPCGLNTPHTHPRATEFNFVVNGSIQAGFLVENGARFVFNEVAPGSAIIFPKGTIHFEFNNACENALFVAAFNDEDPGVDQIAQRFFGLPPAFVGAALGGIGVEEVAGLEAKIPDNVALGTDECLKRCGLTRSDQPTLQRQPRVSANALPSGFSGPPAPASVASPTSSAPSLATPSPQPPAAPAVPSPPPAGASTTTQKAAGDLAGDNAPGSGSPSSKINTLNVALIVVICILTAGYVAIAGWYFVGKRRSRARGLTYFRTGADGPQHGAPLFDADRKQPFESYSASTHDLSTPYDPPSPSPRHSHE